MNKIIIGTDFSDASYNAIRYGVELAKLVNSEIILLHVYQVPVPASEVAVLTEADVRKDAEKHIEILRRRVREDTGQDVAAKTELRYGYFYRELKILCNEIKPFLVIIGAQGKTALNRFLFGSEAVYTMKHLSLPVIAVPAHYTFTGISKVGLACDFHHVFYEIPLDEIGRLMNVFDAELHILNSGKEKKFEPETVFESGMLQGALKKLNPRYHFVAGENDEEAILACAGQLNLDLLMVMPRRHNFFDKLTHHSHTKQFVLHSPVPVLSLHL